MATRFAFWRKIEEDALAEKHAQPGLLSDFILGSQDGLVNVLGVILGSPSRRGTFRTRLRLFLRGGSPRRSRSQSQWGRSRIRRRSPGGTTTSRRSNGSGGR